MRTVRLLRRPPFGRPGRAAAPFRPVPVAVLALAILLGALPGASFAEDAAAGETAGAPSSPWGALDAARRSLAAAGAEQADFVQTYLPAGFSSGEEESGRIALRLPDCLRWDYAEPFPKSFLLCGDQVWSWNAEDRRGQTGSLDRESQPGLDLLLLPIDQLDDRYEASVEPAAAGSDGRVTVHLSPKSEMAERTELTDATLVVDTGTERLVELSYRDQEGNRTRFVLSDYRALGDSGIFKAPDGITWDEME